MLLRLRALFAPERGSTIVPVIGLVAMAGVLTALIASATVHAVSFTTMTRAGVQAQAAADAGLEFMRAQLATGVCPPGNAMSMSYGEAYTGAAGSAELTRLGISGADPYFSASVERPNIITGIWEPGCPVLGLFDSKVRILSTGFASAKGVAEVSGRDEVTVEAVHLWTAGTAAPGIAPSGPAVYSYTTSELASGGLIQSVAGSQPSVLVKTGSVTCKGGFKGAQNLVVAAGNLTITEGCEVLGNVWSQGSTTLQGGVKVDGSIVASSVTHGSSGTVGGGIYTPGAVSINGDGTVLGPVSADSLSLTNGDLRGGAWIQQAATFGNGGDVYADVRARSSSAPNHWSGLHNGAKIITVPAGPGPSPYAAPAQPVVPDWIDYQYSHSDWEGFSYAATLVTCSATQIWWPPAPSQLQQIVNGFGGNPGVIDARACLNGIHFGGSDTLNLAADLVIVANKFNLSNGAITAPPGVRLWLITPDGNPLVDNKSPDCVIGSSFAVSGGFTFPQDSPTMIYTPCKVTISSSTDLRGQIYAGGATITGGGKLRYEPVGLPGHNLDTGAGGGGGILPPLTSLGELEYYHVVAG